MSVNEYVSDNHLLSCEGNGKKQEGSALILLDMRATFDKVHNDILLKILKAGMAFVSLL
jgi:hypothetical protein